MPASTSHGRPPARPGRSGPGGTLAGCVVTVLLWFVAVGIPGAVVLRLSGVETGHQRATAASAPPRAQRRRRATRSRRRAAAAVPAAPPVKRPPPRLPHPTAAPLPAHKVRSSASLVVIV